MKVREFSPQDQRLQRQMKNISKLVRLYNATLDKRHLEKAIKLRNKYASRYNPVTITTNTTTS